MSMCLYMKSGPMGELAKLARQPEALAALAMPAVGDLPVAAKELMETTLSESAFEAQIKAMQQHAAASGWRGRITGWLLARQMRRDLAQVRRQLAAMAEATDAAPAADPPLDLHKSWHLLHYAFTGTAWDGAAPANTLLVGGRAIGEDLGYGPMRIVDPGHTQAFAGFLSAFSLPALERRLDPAEMARLDIYCAGEDDGDVAEMIDDVEHYFPQLRDYVTTAAGRQHGLAIWMM